MDDDHPDKPADADSDSALRPGKIDQSEQFDHHSNMNASTATNTSKAYMADWKNFTRWCRLTGHTPLPPRPEVIGHYLMDLATSLNGSPALSVSTIDRRLSGLAWNYRQRGFTLDRSNTHIANVITAIKRDQQRPPKRKETIQPEDIRAMVSSLSHDLRGLRDRAILLLGYAAGLGRSTIVSLNIGPDNAASAGNRIDIFKDGALVTLRSSKGWREIEVGRGSSEQTCPVRALEQWLYFSRIGDGPLFVRTSRDGTRALNTRLSDKHVARLIKATVLESGVRAELPKADRLALFSGKSLRNGRNAFIKKARPGQPRFQVNSTRAAGL